jgi:hypothetical protein
VLDGFDRRACRARAIERFSRERMVADHEALYARVAAQHVLARQHAVPAQATSASQVPLCA